MEKIEKRVLRVSEMLGENFIEAVLDFRRNTAQSKWLEDAVYILNPSLEQLDTTLSRVIENHNLSDALINEIRGLEADLSYAVGVIAGLHLCGRVDLVPKFAEVYALTTPDREVSQYDLDGEFATAVKQPH